MFRRWEMVDGVPYKNVKSKIDKADLDFVTRFALWQESQPPGHFATRDVTVMDPQSPGTYAAYNEPVFGYLYNNLHFHVILFSNF